MSAPGPTRSTLPRCTKAADLRLGVYTDYAYRRENEAVYGERAFVVFVCALRAFCDSLVLVGRLNPRPGRSHYRLPDDVEFVPLPYHETLTRPHEAIVAMARSLGHFWRALEDLDAVWLIGPYIHSVAYVALARLRGVPVVLGVRQDLPAYTRNRHPRRRTLHLAADALESIWKLYALRLPMVAVGPGLARAYDHGRDVLPITVSLVRDADIIEPPPPDFAADTELRVLSVGRLDTEKNPLLLAEVLAALRAEDPRWRLVVCGDGPLRDALEARLEALDQGGAYELLGYVPVDRGLVDVYRAADAFLHVSWTEGLPQVLFEAFAAGLPVVATDVGGVAEAVGDAALLVQPGDAGAAAASLRRLVAEAGLAERLVAAGTARVSERTLEREAGRVGAFIASRAAQPRRARSRRATM